MNDCPRQNPAYRPAPAHLLSTFPYPPHRLPLLSVRLRSGRRGRCFVTPFIRCRIPGQRPAADGRVGGSLSPVICPACGSRVCPHAPSAPCRWHRPRADDFVRDQPVASVLSVLDARLGGSWGEPLFFSKVLTFTWNRDDNPTPRWEKVGEKCYRSGTKWGFVEAMWHAFLRARASPITAPFGSQALVARGCFGEHTAFRSTRKGAWEFPLAIANC